MSPNHLLLLDEYATRTAVASGATVGKSHSPDLFR